MQGLEFDPGFAPYIMAFRGTLEYLYLDINRFKNFSQKKMRFRQYYKKILEIFNNNLGFYAGCLMWAAYIKTQPKQKILSNPCFGQIYDEQENVSEVEYIIKFTDLFPKDMSYYLGEFYSFDEKSIRLLNLYKDFLVINRGFVGTEFNEDVLIPEDFKPSSPEKYKEIIDNVLESGDLKQLLNYIEV
jgi:hypothetical protein